jgi:hypothetical protein
MNFPVAKFSKRNDVYSITIFLGAISICVLPVGVDLQLPVGRKDEQVQCHPYLGGHPQRLRQREGDPHRTRRVSQPDRETGGFSGESIYLICSTYLFQLSHVMSGIEQKNSTSPFLP